MTVYDVLVLTRLRRAAEQAWRAHAGPGPIPGNGAGPLASARWLAGLAVGTPAEAACSAYLSEAERVWGGR